MFFYYLLKFRWWIERLEAWGVNPFAGGRGDAVGYPRSQTFSPKTLVKGSLPTIHFRLFDTHIPMRYTHSIAPNSDLLYSP